jgi:hypothetical protein
MAATSSVATSAPDEAHTRSRIGILAIFIPFSRNVFFCTIGLLSSPPLTAVGKDESDRSHSRRPALCRLPIQECH